MNKITLPYHKGELNNTRSQILEWTIVQPPSTPPLSHPVDNLHRRLNDYLKKNFEYEYFKGKNITIAINDNTRPIPHRGLIPEVIRTFLAFGASPDNIRIFIASGTHKLMTQSEIALMLPISELMGIAIISHDCDDQTNLYRLGSTPASTEVWINHEYYLSDIKVVIGNIEPHHFMGYSGGVKTAAIGLTGRRTIEQNHAMLGHRLAIVGRYHDNPMRQDVEAIGDLIGIDLAINTVNSSDFEIVEYFIGNPRTIMVEGIEHCQQNMQVPVTCLYDMVIASAGGYPKDINLYQAQKAITHASMFCKPGGVIILAAACDQGVGSDQLESFMVGIANPEDAVKKFQSLGFQVGPHKAFQLALQSNRNRIILISDLPPDVSHHYFMEPAQNLDNAIQLALEQLVPAPDVVVLPHATHTIPFHG